jgi:hypothetical protein
LLSKITSDGSSEVTQRDRSNIIDTTKIAIKQIIATMLDPFMITSLIIASNPSRLAE